MKAASVWGRHRLERCLDGEGLGATRVQTVQITMLSVEEDLRPMRAPLDSAALARLQPLVETELKRRLALSGHALSRLALGGLALSGPSQIQPAFNRRALKDVLSQVHCVDCSVDDQRRFMLFVAPLARRVSLAYAASFPPVEAPAPDLRQVELWLARLESFDPLSALMIDLRYFAGLTVRETASIVGVSCETVVCDLRFAKAWLAAYVGKPLTRRR